MVIDGLGLKREQVVDFIKTQRPTYCQFEAWIKKQPGVKLDQSAVSKLNDSIKGYNHDDTTRKSILGGSNVPDDAAACKDAVNLNNLDDWNEFHTAELK